MTMALGPGVQDIAMRQIQQTERLITRRRDPWEHMRITGLVGEQPTAVFEFSKSR